MTAARYATVRDLHAAHVAALSVDDLTGHAELSTVPRPPPIYFGHEHATFPPDAVLEGNDVIP